MSTNTTAPSYINSAEDANASDELIATSAQPTELWNVNTSISSADVQNPESLPESAPGETARIHAALSHPYFSNHPTQTSASGVGDIVIDNRTKKTHRLALSRGKLVGIVAVALVIIITTIVLMIGRGDNLQSLLMTYDDTVSNVEELLPMTDYNTISFRRFFNQEQYNQLNNDISSYVVFQQRLSKIKENNLNGEQLNLVNELKEIMSYNAPLLQQFLAQYNAIYKAIQENDETYFNELAINENADLRFIGKRMLNYYDDKKYWDAYIQDNNCDDLTDAEMVEPCEQVRSSLEQNNENLEGSTSIVRSLGDYTANVRAGASEIIGKLLEEGVGK